MFALVDFLTVVSLALCFEQLSDLSTLLHQFHSMPHPNLDSAFPPSPASANSGTFKQNFNDLQEATKASGRSQAGRQRERAQGAAEPFGITLSCGKNGKLENSCRRDNTLKGPL